MELHQVRSDREAYAKAMIAGNYELAYRIEQMHGLDGYPPELVCIGLTALANGEDVEAAISRYIGE